MMSQKMVLLIFLLMTIVIHRSKIVQILVDAPFFTSAISLTCNTNEMDISST